MTKTSLTLVALLATAAARADLLQNGGFETGDWTGWTFDNDAGNTFVGANYGVSEGEFAALTGQSSFDGLVVLSQSVATVPGESYAISFDLKSTNLGEDEGGNPLPDVNAFQASFGSGSLSFTDLVSTEGFTHYEFTGIAGAGVSTLSFAMSNDPGVFVLDQASVLGPSPVPEPASFAALGLGLLALRRRARNAR